MGFLTSRLLRLKEKLEKGREAPAEVTRQVKEAVTQAKQVAEARVSLLEAAEGEAAQQYLAKMAKIDSAHAALALDHMATIAEDEEDAVRRYREKTVFGGDGAATAGTTGVGRSLILADNISYNEPQPPPPTPSPSTASQRQSNTAIVPWIIVAALTAGMIGAGATYLLTRDTEEPTVVEKKVETDTPNGTKTTTTTRGVGSTVELVQPK